MQFDAEPSAGSKMESTKLICDREIPVQLQKVDSSAASLRRSLDSIKARAEESVQNQAKLAKLKANLRQSEDELVRVLAAKTRKEEKLMAVRDSISDARARIEGMKNTIQIQRARRDEYATIISQQSVALATSEEKAKGDTERKEEIQEAISWYNQVLGFRIEGGHGVKFTFHNIDKKSPDEKYSFTVRYANDSYNMLDCDPQVNGMKGLICELNRTNDLFEFVRIIREKFQEAVAQGSMPRSMSLQQDSISITLSAPLSSISTERSESPVKEHCHQFQQGELNKQIGDVKDKNESPENMKENKVMEVNRYPKKVNHGRGAKSLGLSPASASTLRRSPRFKVNR